MKHTTQKRITEIENLILENDLNLSNPYDASMATAIIAIIAPFPPETTIWDIINTLHPDDHTSLPLHLLYKIHQLQFIVSDSLIKSPLNLLNGDTSLYSPDETWKAGFYKNIASFLVQKGLPCSLT